MIGISKQALALLDSERAQVEALSKPELARRFDGRTERRIEASQKGRLEVVTSGTWDARDPDPTTTFYVWIDVRPVWVRRIPIVRRWLGAHATVVVD